MINTIRAEVITIGDEILFGQITDTNTQWISTELTNIGVRTIRKTSVGDEAGVILDALREATQRADVVLITGGLRDGLYFAARRAVRDEEPDDAPDAAEAERTVRVARD